MRNMTHRRLAAQRLVRPAMAVIVLPLLRFLSHLIQGAEDLRVQEFAAEPSIEAFYIGVLCRLARLDEGQGDLALFAPRIELVADELQTVVDSEHRG